MIVSINLNEERQKDFADMLSKEQRDSARRIWRSSWASC